VVVRTSLKCGEDSKVDLVFNVVHDGTLRSVLTNALTVENETTTRTTQSLVSSGSNDIRIFEGAVLVLVFMAIIAMF